MSNTTELMQRALEMGFTGEAKPAEKASGWFGDARKSFASMNARERWSREHFKSVRRFGADGRAGV